MDVRRAPYAQGVVLFDARVFPQATPAMCDPSYWSDTQMLSGRGGRGMATLVRGTFGAGVLRHYRRGGLVSRFANDRYLFLGESRVRCAREFLLLAELFERGLPVPQPLLARWHRQGWFYRADLMTRFVNDTRTLAECLRDTPDEVEWRKVGATIARFHSEGVFHADLNAHNVLIDAERKIWLIDFDRGAFRTPATSWQKANLDRLRRSLDKLGPVADSQLEELLAGYDAKLRDLALHGGTQ